MFFGNDKLSKLEDDCAKLRIENIRLKADVDNYRQRIDREFTNASFGIDWDAMKVFSIERNWGNGFPQTILGYMLSEPAIHTEDQVTYKDVVRGWTLHCSAEKHEELVKEFTEWKGKKTK